MAARKVRTSLVNDWREKIKTSMLINRLQDFSLGKDGVVMTGDQVRAAIALIKKTVPDLQSVDLQGQVDSKITVVLNRFAGAAIQSPKESSQE